LITVEKHIKLGNRSIIAYITRKKVKHLRLVVKGDGSVRVSVPTKVSDRKADEFILKNQHFILKTLDKIESERTPVLTADNFIDGASVVAYGTAYTIRIARGEKNSCAIKDGEIHIIAKDPDDRLLIEKIFKTFARYSVEQVILALCLKHYLAFSKKVKSMPFISYKSMSSRWGSCTPSKNKMTFNYALFAAPMDCVEYVVVHEYSHFIEQNHSPRFYAVVEKILPDYKKRREALKKVTVNKY